MVFNSALVLVVLWWLGCCLLLVVCSLGMVRHLVQQVLNLCDKTAFAFLKEFQSWQGVLQS